MFYCLFRNVCQINAPKNGWNQKLDPHDYSDAANIERLRIARNDIYAHATSSSLNDEEFDATWSDIKQTLIALGGQKYESIIDELKFSTLDPDRSTQCRNELEHWCHLDPCTKRKINKLEGMEKEFILLLIINNTPSIPIRRQRDQCSFYFGVCAISIHTVVSVFPVNCLFCWAYFTVGRSGVFVELMW